MKAVGVYDINSDWKCLYHISSNFSLNEIPFKFIEKIFHILINGSDTGFQGTLFTSYREDIPLNNHFYRLDSLMYVTDFRKPKQPDLDFLEGRDVID